MLLLSLQYGGRVYLLTMYCE